MLLSTSTHCPTNNNASICTATAQKDATKAGPHFIVVGAGIAGLSFAIACRRLAPSFEVTVLEKARSISTVGAGIHIPPNACRILSDLGLLDRLKKAGAYQVDNFNLLRYENGQVIVQKPLKGYTEREFGAEWLAIHRGDYQNVLLDAAVELGVTIVTDAEVASVQFATEGTPTVFLKSGERMAADGVVGADGIWSSLRGSVLDCDSAAVQPLETGNLAYRATFTKSDLLGIDDEIDELLEKRDIQVWLGPGKHAVFYPLRDNTEFNVVLVTDSVMDDLPKDVKIREGCREEMLANFDGWHPLLNQTISRVKQVLKWKLVHLPELEQWNKGPLCLIGDASHPTLPYQGQGAAMAVEDGVALAAMLSRLTTNINDCMSATQRCNKVASIFQAYTDIRKARVELNVQGAIHTRHFYHLFDGEEQVRRDQELSRLPDQAWKGSCSFNWGDFQYQKDMLGFDVVADVRRTLLQTCPWVDIFE